MKRLKELLGKIKEAISVDTASWENEYKKKPKGRGSWWFKIDGKTDFRVNADYGDAVKQAVKKAKYSVKLAL